LEDELSEEGATTRVVLGWTKEYGGEGGRGHFDPREEIRGTLKESSEGCQESATALGYSGYWGAKRRWKKKK